VTDATLDALIERAAIMWADECTCSPRPSSMSACKCGERQLAESAAARLVGVVGWDVSPHVRFDTYKREAELWKRKR
jgi:hypothetical protein